MGDIFYNLVQETIKAIEAGKGTKTLSMRSIARAAGCSHVNVYNYFNGLDGLVWKAYEKSLADFTGKCTTKMIKPGAGRNPGSGFAGAVCDYALKNEGLYRLLWLESLPQPNPPDITTLVRQYTENYVQQVAVLLGVNANKSAKLAGFLFSYVMGEVSGILAGRIFDSPHKAVQRTINSAGELWNILKRRMEE